MEPARAAGRSMAGRGRILVLSRGKPVDPSRAVGRIRFGGAAGQPRVTRDRGSGHRRIRFEPRDGGWQGAWIVP